MSWTAAITSLLFVLHWGATAAVAARVISKRRTQGVSLAWLAILAWIPIVGIVLYILIGESWLTRRRVRRMQAARDRARPTLERLARHAAADPEDAPHTIEAYNRIAHATSQFPTLAGNTIDVLDDADAFFPAFEQAIQQATESIDLLFYIYSPGGRVDRISNALIQAAARGVAVRILVDAVGSRPLLTHPGTLHALRKAGVDVRAALPVHFPRQLFARVDLRNHRKLAVIDTHTAFTGSMNLADPKIFKASANVGPWIDVMTRIQGPAANALAALFDVDWDAESDDTPNSTGQPHREPESPGTVPLQIVTSGPGDDPDAFRRVLLQSIYDARSEVVISTPYFVPDDALLSAIMTADLRGAEVTLVVPERVDSVLVRHASRSYYTDLLASGVEIRRYQPGLLHAKTITIDRKLALVGSANMDRRSLWINFELSIIAHDPATAERVRAVQQRYIDASVKLTKTNWNPGNFIARTADNAAQLLAPIL